MSILSFLKKKKAPAGLQESRFECQREGLTIRGTEYRAGGDNLPIAILSHGFMANQETVKQYAFLLAQMGYAAFVYDFCGGCVVKGKSDGKTTDMSVLTEVKDLEAVIRYARSLPYTSDTLVLGGASQGGLVSSLAAAKPENKVSKLILLYPAFCIPDDARAGQMMFAKFDPSDPPEIIRCGPMKLGKCYPNDVVKMDPFAEIQGYTGPVIILHGTDDKIVNISYAHRAEEAYKQAGAQVTLKIIENGAHGFSKEHDQIALNAIKEFA